MVEEKKEATLDEVTGEVTSILHTTRAQHPAMNLHLGRDQKKKGDAPGPLDDGAISAYNCMAGASFLKLEKLWTATLKFIADMKVVIEEAKKTIETLKTEKVDILKQLEDVKKAFEEFKKNILEAPGPIPEVIIPKLETVIVTETPTTTV